MNLILCGPSIKKKIKKSSRVLCSEKKDMKWGTMDENIKFTSLNMIQFM